MSRSRFGPKTMGTRPTKAEKQAMVSCPIGLITTAASTTATSAIASEILETECFMIVLPNVRSRRRTLAKLRHEVEPVDQPVLGRFATSWQGVVKRRHGADALLQRLDVEADRGLRDVQRLPGAHEALVIQHGQERFQLIEFHGLPAFA